MCVVAILAFLGLLMSLLFLRQVLRHPGLWTTSVPTILGSVLLFISLGLPWVEFSPLAYVTPAILRDILPDVVAPLLELYGQNMIAKLLDMFGSVAAIPGALVWLLSASGWSVRVIPLCVTLSAILALIWFFTSPSLSAQKRYWGGMVQLVGGAGMAFVLILSMPQIDWWIDRMNVWYGFAAVLLGVHMGVGVWMALWGFLLISIGGLAEIAGLVYIE